VNLQALESRLNRTCRKLQTRMRRNENRKWVSTTNLWRKCSKDAVLTHRRGSPRCSACITCFWKQRLMPFLSNG
jgi:hypothetical protein